MREQFACRCGAPCRERMSFTWPPVVADDLQTYLKNLSTGPKQRTGIERGIRAICRGWRGRTQHSMIVNFTWKLGLWEVNNCGRVLLRGCTHRPTTGKM